MTEEPVEATVVEEPEYSELRQGASEPQRRSSPLEHLSDVQLTVTVELGSQTLSIADLLKLGEGAVVELDRSAGAPVDVKANGRLIARADVVVVDDELGVRITEIVDRP